MLSPAGSVDTGPFGRWPDVDGEGKEPADSGEEHPTGNWRYPNAEIRS
ncbi:MULTISPECIES: hypothetical protein [Streptomyces]